MANSTSNLDLIQASQASKEVTANAFFNAASNAATYGRRQSTSSGLTWGFYGGSVYLADGARVQVANGTLTLAASTTNYVVASKSTGAVTAATATTDWNNTAAFWRLYSVVCGAAAVTSWTDHRGGAFDASGTVPLVTNVTATAIDISAAHMGRYLRFTDAAAKTVTVQPQSSQAVPLGFETTLRNVGAGDLTLAAGSGVTILAPSGGTLVLAERMTATLKRVDGETWELYGQTVPA